MDTVKAQSDAVVGLIAATPKVRERMLIGIAGPPGSGKSTVAEAVVKQLNDDSGHPDQAALLPMDGFHLDNEILKVRGLLARKGAPETFDAAGLLELILNVRTGIGDIYYPLFDRGLDHSINDAGLLKAETSIVIVEGNYLLLKTPVWDGLKEQFDATVFLKPTLETLENRLLQRWLSFGFSSKEATEKAHGNDLINAQLVLAQSAEADLILDEEAG